MNLKSIIISILANPQAIETTISDFVHLFKATTAPTTVVVPATPASSASPGGPEIPAMAAVTKKPSPVIKEAQHILNLIVKPQPPLEEDGWLGDKTEKAIGDGIAMAKPYLAMLG